MCVCVYCTERTARDGGVPFAVGEYAREIGACSLRHVGEGPGAAPHEGARD